MPIAEQFRHFYGKTWREVIRPRILARAKNCCERCGVPNHQRVRRTGGWWLDIKVTWATERSRCIRRAWRNQNGELMGPRRPRGSVVRTVRIVLTIAHLDQIPGHDDDANLQAMCQWCHLDYDRHQHLTNGKETRLDRKDANRPLLKGPTDDATRDALQI